MVSWNWNDYSFQDNALNPTNKLSWYQNKPYDVKNYFVMMMIKSNNQMNFQAEKANFMFNL